MFLLILYPYKYLDISVRNKRLVPVVYSGLDYFCIIYLGILVIQSVALCTLHLLSLELKELRLMAVTCSDNKFQS